MVRAQGSAQWIPSPGLADAPVLDRLCSHFVLSLTLRQPGQFNLRRDWSSLLSLVGRHLVWPPAVLGRLRGYLLKRCEGNALWRGHQALDDRAFIVRHGSWRGPYEDGTLFFYIDEYIKDAPKDLLAVLSASADWLARDLKKQHTQVQKNIDALATLLQLNPAERAVLLYGTLARYQRELRGLLVEFKVSNAQEAYAAIAAVAGVDQREVAEALRAGSRLERIGMVENLISEHNITDLADLMKVSDQLPPVLMREYRDPDELMAVFTPPGQQECAAAGRLRLRGRGRAGAHPAAAARRGHRGQRRQRAAVRPARHRQDRAGQGLCAAGRAHPVRGGVRRPRRQLAERAATATARCRSARSSSRAAPRWRCCSTRWKTSSRRCPPTPRS